ncbi:Flagellar biosynthetic protein FlhB [Candidatus Cyrtobacter comes]|uniref:Flagellar biosynthetic protein FlhB n=1 Tax=Candidatus Cyrtobacter comes TaxID=675776 RepID=A0ABU5L8Q9_9RICK|nr:flagellar biosynthesis protein FlhB [Candidatus Cyrtobacter comes]MDZ5762511.1 Flagellar biosynthetic protein FlhB [Candidatus Cyrtobacter comes]
MAEEQKREQDSSQKTEDPTPRQIEEARKKGKVINSKELSSFVLFLSFTVFILLAGDLYFRNVFFSLKYYFENIYNFSFSNETWINAAFNALSIIMKFVIIPALIISILIFINYLVQHSGLVTSLDPITPKLSKISPIAGLKRIFSMKSVVELIKGIIKMLFVGCAIYLGIKSDYKVIKNSYTIDLSHLLQLLKNEISEIMIATCCVMFLIGILDYIYQRYEYIKGLKMSKQDIKDEHKNTEGDQDIKQKRKQIMRERLNKMTLTKAQDADVIVTNPTHYAIALEYTPASFMAPRVIAKGADLLALEIKKIGQSKNIPIFEDKLLARKLYNEVEIEQMIPVRYYNAVAKVMLYVANLKGKSYFENKKPKKG